MAQQLFSLRIDKQLLDIIKRDAKNQGRSANSQIVQILKDKYLVDKQRPNLLK